GTLGASGFYQTNDTRGRIPLVPAARAGAAAVFDFEEVGLGRVSVLAGGRVDVRRLAADANAALGRSDETRDYTALSGTLGVVYRPAAAVALTANLGRAWRAPTLFELFANGPHLGEARYEQGDPGLRPEAGTNLDVGVRWTGTRVRAEVAGYRNRIGRFIYITPTARFYSTPPDSLRVFQYAQ